MDRTYPLLLIRHAEAVHNVTNLTGGWTDTDLTPTGQRQAARLAARLQRELAGRPMRLLASDFKRTVQTAHVLSQALGVPYTLEPGFRDYNNGIAAGMPRDLADRLRAPFPEDRMSWRSHPGAESLSEYVARVCRTLEALPNFPGYTLIVTHAGVINIAVLWWIGHLPHYPDQPWVHCDLNPTSLTLLYQTAAAEPAIQVLNDCAHLYPDEDDACRRLNAIDAEYPQTLTTSPHTSEEL